MDDHRRFRSSASKKSIGKRLSESYARLKKKIEQRPLVFWLVTFLITFSGGVWQVFAKDWNEKIADQIRSVFKKEYRNIIIPYYTSDEEGPLPGVLVREENSLEGSYSNATGYGELMIRAPLPIQEGTMILIVGSKPGYRDRIKSVKLPEEKSMTVRKNLVLFR